MFDKGEFACCACEQALSLGGATAYGERFLPLEFWYRCSAQVLHDSTPRSSRAVRISRGSFADLPRLPRRVITRESHSPSGSRHLFSSGRSFFVPLKVSVKHEHNQKPSGRPLERTIDSFVICLPNEACLGNSLF